MLWDCAILAAGIVSGSTCANPYGATAHFTATEYGTRVKAAQMMKDIGFGWSRCDFKRWEAWDAKSRTRDWRRFDAVAQDVVQAGRLDLLGVIGYPTKRKGVSKKEKELAQWESFIRDLVGRYGKTIRVWEICNEVNVERFNPGLDYETYAENLARAYRVIKSVDPTLRVTTSGIARIDTNCVERIYRKIGNSCFDILNVHWYNLAGLPEGNLDGKLRNLRKLMVENGDADKPIWLSEFGYATQTPSEQNRGILRAELAKAKQGKANWNVWYVGGLSGKERVRDRRLMAGLPGMLPEGSSVRSVAPNELEGELKRSSPDAIIYPFTAECATKTIPMVVDFVAQGGVLVDLGGSPKELIAALEAVRDKKGKAILSDVKEIENWCPATEEEQAWMVARAASIAFNEGVEKVFWYNFRSSELDLYDRESHFGIVRKDFSEKPAAKAWRTFIRMRPNGSIQRTGSRNPAVKDPVWRAEWTRPDGKIAGLVWTPQKAFEIAGRKASEDIRFFDCFGGELRVDVRDGKFALEISESPVYYLGVLGDVKPKSLR